MSSTESPSESGATRPEAVPQTGPPAQPEAQPGAQPGVQPGVQQGVQRGRANTTSRDMVISMLVIVAVVGVLLLLVPRPNAIPERTLDVTSAAQGAQATLGFAPAVPSGLPGGWTARAADVLRGTDGIPTWHLTYTTPSGRYAGVQEARNATAAWEARQVTDGPEQGKKTIGSHTWIVRSREDRGVTSYVLREGDRTTVVTGTAIPTEIDAFAAAVAP